MGWSMDLSFLYLNGHLFLTAPFIKKSVFALVTWECCMSSPQLGFPCSRVWLWAPCSAIDACWDELRRALQCWVTAPSKSRSLVYQESSWLSFCRSAQCLVSSVFHLMGGWYPPRCWFHLCVLKCRAPWVTVELVAPRFPEHPVERDLTSLPCQFLLTVSDWLLWLVSSAGLSRSREGLFLISAQMPVSH